MTLMHTSLPDIILPQKIREFIECVPQTFISTEERMRFTIELARLNTIGKTGGPFGAAVFESHSGKLVAAGVNVVVKNSCSHAHAEMVALFLAQQKLSTYDLGGSALPCHELVSSCEPCAMCFGALIWSGVKKLVFGASGKTAEAAGFDEGPKPHLWIRALEQRGIEVTGNVCSKEADAVLDNYVASGGLIYNAGKRA
ncbi:MAG: nucleoside deaminase [Chlorobiaceae bacterium]|nr:nucleoside deaminase [Chlorobiaceae bacterium]NTW63179.1 nucleoside deaminase [Chlorobiaceae bacterium]